MSNSVIYCGDAAQQLTRIKTDSVDCIISDPPYGISFLGHSWDADVPGTDIWTECNRVLKPGGFSFIMSSPRQDVLTKMISNLENAGFHIGFTSIYWAYASGMPKGMNLYKSLKKRGLFADFAQGSYTGFNPKPAVEVIVVAMKPLSDKTYLSQAQKNGKGVTWLDDCKIPLTNGNGDGRFPANLLVSDDILNDGQVFSSANSTHPIIKRSFFVKPTERVVVSKKKAYGDSGSFSKYFDLDSWWNKQYQSLPESVKKVYPFLIASKPSQKERSTGTDKNDHPTVKPLKLMSYLITLASRVGDTVLDPFCGSGTTGVAATILNRNFIGIELDSEYAATARLRIKSAGQDEIKTASILPNKTVNHTVNQYYC